MRKLILREYKMLFCVFQMYLGYFPNKLLKNISQILSLFPDKQIFQVIHLEILFSGMLQMTLPNWYITLREPVKLPKTFFPTKYKQSLYFAHKVTWNAIYQQIHWTLKVAWLNQNMLTFPLEKERRLYSLGSEKTKKWLLNKKLQQISYIIKGLWDHQTSSNNYLLYYVNPRSQ